MTKTQKTTRRRHLEHLARLSALPLLGSAAACRPDQRRPEDFLDEPRKKTEPTEPAPTEAETGAQAQAEPEEAPAAAAPEPTDPPETEQPREAVSFDLEVGDGLAYSLKRMEVPEGAMVTVTIRHTGKMPSVAMGHNFVLLNNEITMRAFANAAMAAAETAYIPAQLSDRIIAHTKLVGGGESDTVTFPAPAPGTYTYLCSFPGHYTAMNGQLVVA